MSDIKKEIDTLYVNKKREANPYTAPELLPDGIISDQCKSIITVFEKELSSLKLRITMLENLTIGIE